MMPSIMLSINNGVTSVQMYINKYVEAVEFHCVICKAPHNLDWTFIHTIVIAMA